MSNPVEPTAPPTSGVIGYDLDARAILDFALKKLRVVDAGRAPGATETATALRELNLLLKGWQKYESLWRLTEGLVTLTANTNSYLLSPVPHRVISCRYKNTSGNDLPMVEMTRSEYFDLPQKTNTGIPHSYYVDYQRTSTTIYVWQPLVSVTTETIPYTYYRKFDAIANLNEGVDVRSEWLEVVGYNLAQRLGPDFGRVNSAAFAEIKEQAIILKQELLDDDREDFIRLVPGYGREVGW